MSTLFCGIHTSVQVLLLVSNVIILESFSPHENGGTIIWDGDPLAAQMNIQATYEVPGGANPALLLDNPNFNKKSL